MQFGSLINYVVSFHCDATSLSFLLHMQLHACNLNKFTLESSLPLMLVHIFSICILTKECCAPGVYGCSIWN